MDWRVHYRHNGEDYTAVYLAPGDAIEAACLLMDEGIDVCGIGRGSVGDSIQKAAVARIYSAWLWAARLSR